MNESPPTFAYALLSTSWSKELENELSEFYWGGIIEAFIDCEEQAFDSEDLWPFGWGNSMKRIAPVQLTNGWDPRPYLLELFLSAGIQPQFSSGSENELPNIFYFNNPQNSINNCNQVLNIKKVRDAKRFDFVLKKTLSLCKSESTGILFIGGWGFSYEKDNLNTQEQEFLTECGLLITSRHE